MPAPDRLASSMLTIFSAVAREREMVSSKDASWDSKPYRSVLKDLTWEHDEPPMEVRDEMLCDSVSRLDLSLR